MSTIRELQKRARIAVAHEHRIRRCLRAVPVGSNKFKLYRKYLELQQQRAVKAVSEFTSYNHAQIAAFKNNLN